MKNNFRNKFWGILLVQLSIVLIISSGCKEESDRSWSDRDVVPMNTNKDITDIAVASPPLSEETFPCSDCHEGEETNTQKRVLVDMHEEISAMFNHDSENRWCLDCHTIDNRDSLHLASGKLIGFDESYKLCGQCHGDKLRDWKVGVHGKRTGEWNGKKQYLLCVECHNPHSPRFQKLKPMPPPIRQEEILFKEN